MNLTDNRHDADEGLGEASNHISVSFPSVSRTTLSYQRITPTRPRLAHPIVPPAVPSPCTPVDPSRPSYLQQCHSSPSTCSTASSTSIDTNNINWFSASTALGGLWSSPSTHSVSSSADEQAQADHPHHNSAASISPYAIPTEYYLQTNNVQSATPTAGAAGLLPAWNGGAGTSAAGAHHVQAHGHSHDSVGAYTLLSASEGGFVVSDAYQVSAQQTTTPRNAQISQGYAAHSHIPSPTTYASLPATPTQPRHPHRFTSLPSLYTTGVCDASAISPLALSPVSGEEWHIASEPSSAALSPNDAPLLHNSVWSIS